MTPVGLIGGLALILVVLWDGFEAVVLPRRVAQRLRLVTLVARGTWSVWSIFARRLPPGYRRETYLSYYGPLLLLMLLATWAVGLVVGLALVHWGVGSAVIDVGR